MKHNYAIWRAERLQQAEQTLAASLADKQGSAAFISLASTGSADYYKTLAQIPDAVDRYGFVCYRWQEAASSTTEHITSISAQLVSDLQLGAADTGVLLQEGVFSLLQDKTGENGKALLPYTNRRMNWHTDGYYNRLKDTIRCFTLHCLHAAASGGALSLLDDALVYIHLRDNHADAAQLLSHPQAMMLPANQDADGHDRPDRYAPVFGWDGNKRLSTRFTMRSRNIEWRDENTAQAALLMIEAIDALAAHQVTITLQAGEGIITRNVLHSRSAFTDSISDSGHGAAFENAGAYAVGTGNDEIVSAKSSSSSAGKRQVLRGRFSRFPSIA